MSLNNVSKKLKQRLKEALTEKIEVLPQGRGHIVVITHKRVVPKSKEFKRKDARLCLARIRSNPEDISLACFLAPNDIPRFYLFPEGRRLEYEERLSLFSALGATLTASDSRRLVSNDSRKQIKKAKRRFKSWLTRNKLS